jgi:ligand-binding SRPBCC domain-containing protein
LLSPIHGIDATRIQSSAGHPQFMKLHEYHSELLLQSPLDVVFPFFSDAANLEAITPPRMRFRIVTPKPIAMRVGAVIDYRFRVRGFPLGWRSEITAWDPPFCFVDEQRRGPYRLWKHEHRFEECDGGTRALDIVHYAVAFDFFSHRLLVKPDIQRIFAFRTKELLKRFGGKLQSAAFTR